MGVFDEVRAIGVGTRARWIRPAGMWQYRESRRGLAGYGPLVSQRSGVPAHVENDVNAAAVGAATVLGGADGMAGTIAFLNFGTGLAAGIVENGVLMHGYSGAAGEIGISQSNLIASSACGQYGCLETVCSGASVGRLWPNADPPMPDLIRRAKKREPRPSMCWTW